MRAVLFVSLVFLSAFPALSQTITIARDPTLPGFRAPNTFDPSATRIQVSIGVTRPSSTATTQDQLAAQEELRRLLYESAARECGVIGDTFKAECRIASLNISSNANNRGNDGIFANANVTFELGKKP
jgi:hypothetical protein